ncbi:hypothetical protein [Endozoicomonas ascidiicola]|uniref:hypothetical protein n=1 Tax=Endozoicomonas ascidiicola TaxID=1698521 RepID=UPI000B121BBF|nr:hypothetical protein [Endozoicomonas ascidiicola]
MVPHSFSQPPVFQASGAEPFVSDADNQEQEMASAFSRSVKEHEFCEKVCSDITQVNYFYTTTLHILKKQHELDNCERCKIYQNARKNNKIVSPHPASVMLTHSQFPESQFNKTTYSEKKTGDNSKSNSLPSASSSDGRQCSPDFSIDECSQRIGLESETSHIVVSSSRELKKYHQLATTQTVISGYPLLAITIDILSYPGTHSPINNFFPYSIELVTGPLTFGDYLNLQVGDMLEILKNELGNIQGIIIFSAVLSKVNARFKKEGVRDIFQLVEHRLNDSGDADYIFLSKNARRVTDSPDIWSNQSTLSIPYKKIQDFYSYLQDLSKLVSNINEVGRLARTKQKDRDNSLNVILDITRESVSNIKPRVICDLISGNELINHSFASLSVIGFFYKELISRLHLAGDNKNMEMLKSFLYHLSYTIISYRNNMSFIDFGKYRPSYLNSIKATTYLLRVNIDQEIMEILSDQEIDILKTKASCPNYFYKLIKKLLTDISMTEISQIKSNVGYSVFPARLPIDRDNYYDQWLQGLSGDIYHLMILRAKHGKCTVHDIQTGHQYILIKNDDKEERVLLPTNFANATARMELTSEHDHYYFSHPIDIHDGKPWVHIEFRNVGFDDFTSTFCLSPFNSLSEWRSGGGSLNYFESLIVDATKE